LLAARGTFIPISKAEAERRIFGSRRKATENIQRQPLAAEFVGKFSRRRKFG